MNTNLDRKLNVKVKQTVDKVFVKIKRPLPEGQVLMIHLWNEGHQVKSRTSLVSEEKLKQALKTQVA